jgi:hypothetical protein
VSEIVTHGWAVISGRRILVKTVSDTRRAALVNWLIAEKVVFVDSTWTDERIENEWHERSSPQDICTTVRVTWVMEDKA